MWKMVKKGVDPNGKPFKEVIVKSEPQKAAFERKGFEAIELTKEQFVSLTKGRATKPAPPKDLTIEEVKALLDAEGIEYDGRLGLDKLKELL